MEVLRTVHREVFYIGSTDTVEHVLADVANHVFLLTVNHVALSLAYLQQLIMSLSDSLWWVMIFFTNSLWWVNSFW